MYKSTLLYFLIILLLVSVIRADIISTYGGSSTTTGSSGDSGPATSASLGYPWAIACDSSNNLYIADQNNHRIRMITATSGIITTIAGIGTSGFSGDSGSATSAALNTPLGVVYDTSGNLYISDTYNQRVRKVITSSGGKITAFAGSSATGSSSGGYSGEGVAATSAELNTPYGLASDTSNNIYVADYGNHRIRKITFSSNFITTIAGSGATGSTSGSFSGDGSAATSATLNGPFGVAVDSSGIILKK